MMTAIAAHRGGAILWPENSLTAFRHSLALPLEQIELDVHASAEGEPVVIHDPTLDRTTDGSGPVVARPLAALRGLRLRGTGGEAVPTLAEVLALLAPAGKALRLEVKADAAGRPYPGLVPRCLGLLDAAGMRGRCILMSFQPLSVAEAARAGGLAGVALLVEARPWRGRGVALAIAAARAAGATELGLPVGEPTPEDVAALRAAGLGLACWGANEAAGIRRALVLGLDAITTDDPVLALSLRGGVAAGAEIG
jgi:glycerophosphoryl diester phosphodiesterase